MIDEPLFPVPSDASDAELDAVEAELHRLDPAGDQVAAVLRDTLDQLYDGQHTGRWNYDQLHKTEKTHMGTLVEINLHRQFGFADGDATDYRIAGIEVDCKYSMTYGGWELPPEAIGHLCLLITANDETSTWSQAWSASATNTSATGATATQNASSQPPHDLTSGRCGPSTGTSPRTSSCTWTPGTASASSAPGPCEAPSTARRRPTSSSARSSAG
jgi:hypothetical protein